MLTDPTAPPSEGLSCYTENLAGYLSARAPGSAELLARSVRLAVDRDTGRFSHHNRALNDLPDGRRLGYRGAPDAETALRGIAAELAERGRVLVVADSGALPWVCGTADAHAPHLLLVDGRTRNGDWHVVDGFSALFSGGGSQDPFSGTLSTAELTTLLCFPHGLSEVHRTRNTLAFGFPVPPPRYETYQWLVEERGSTKEELPGKAWLTGPPALAETARRLTADLSGQATHGVLEDVWAAAQHHLFRDNRMLGTAGTAGTVLSSEERQAIGITTSKWRELPRVLRFAANSARRGRPRPSLIDGAFTALADAEEQTLPLHRAHGYAASTAAPVPRPLAHQGGRL
ncbi:hypothetical protein [Streptomyces sp. AC602_WCS936]|uniref:hypothetical protein n=1 Tax=Streptomyces sp. AC602_WCS936 TaxID=2823685 RepID=UPI0020B855AA|nr:hypothetical protein [Streptomyces sp. AC602_WCS936]